VDVEVVLNDTALLAPAGHQTLASLGKVMGLPKLDVGDYKECMDKLLKQNPKLFYEYAMRDSVIALSYWIAIHAIAQEAIGYKLFQTVGSLAVGYLGQYLKKAGLSRQKFHGKQHSNFKRFENIAADSFHGGRGESLCAGVISDCLYDVDLSGAYSIGMAHLPQLDHSKALITTDDYMFLGVDVAGFVECRFQFPPHVKAPCLPVKTKRGLIYPLSGVTHCTAYELTLAKRIGAELEIISGLIIPPVIHQEEPVLKRFVKDIRLERAKHAKGSLYNSFYKLIGNALYVRFALGVSPKQYFNSRTGGHDQGVRDVNTNPYFAALTTGFIRTALGELAYELTTRGHIVVSMTTDGLLTDCPRDVILREIRTPFLMALKSHIEDSGQDPDSYLELKCTTNALFSWKTRGQYALDHGGVSALAGLQKPRGDHESVKAWFLENVANDEVKTLNEIRRLSSLVEVYKGSPFLSIMYQKYISTQFDFKRKPVQFREGCIASSPWRDTAEMDTYVKRYVTTFPYKVNSASSLKQLEQHISQVEARRKIERTRKRRLEEPFRVFCLYPKVLRLCVR
jgi:hypothetical protein